jgi:hypothetical protein
MKLRQVAIALTFLVAFASDSWGQSRQPPTKTSAPNPAQQERGTDNSPVVVRILPAEKSQSELDNDLERQKSDRRQVELTGDLANYTKLLFIATGLLGLIATGLVGVGYFQVRQGKRSVAAAVKAADASLLSAEALIGAERAHLFVIVKSTELHQALRGSVYYGDSESPELLDSKIPRPYLEFAIKNTGRTAAIMQDVSYQLVQADAETTEWQFAYQDTIVHTVVEGGEETTPPTPCVSDHDLTIADSKAAIDGSRPIYFYGSVRFRDTFRRQYQYSWRYEYRARRFVLVHEEERPIEA